MKTCFFLGHRDTPGSIMPHLVAAIKNYIQVYGTVNFVVGNYGNFDRMAASAVIEAKGLYPDVQLQLLLPYHPATRTIQIPTGFDGSFYPFETSVPPRYAIARANRRMIDISDYLITFVRNPGNARELLLYAQRRKQRGLLHIEKLADITN